jgi:hypothetical protein
VRLPKVGGFQTRPLLIVRWFMKFSDAFTSLINPLLRSLLSAIPDSSTVHALLNEPQKLSMMCPDSWWVIRLVCPHIPTTMTGKPQRVQENACAALVPRMCPAPRGTHPCHFVWCLRYFPRVAGLAHARMSYAHPWHHITVDFFGEPNIFVRKAFSIKAQLKSSKSKVTDYWKKRP